MEEEKDGEGGEVEEEKDGEQGEVVEEEVDGRDREIGALTEEKHVTTPENINTHYYIEKRILSFHNNFD